MMPLAFVRRTAPALLVPLLAGAVHGQTAVGSSQGTPVRLPSAFVENRGQWRSPARFVLHRSDMNAHFTDGAVTLEMFEERPRARARGHVVRLAFVGGADGPATAEGDARLPGQHNYLTGEEAAAWTTGVRRFARVVYRHAAPGIDVQFREHDGHVEYDLLVAADADLRGFAIQCTGIEGLRIRDDGALVLDTGSGALVQPVPKTWQVRADGTHRIVPCRYRLLGRSRYGFDVAAEPGTPLVIDPALKWSAFLGGGSYDYARDVEVGADGSVYVAGYTVSTAFPATVGAFDTSYNGAEDTFVAKLNAAGTALVYATFLGGSLADVPHSLALTSSGEATVVGFTASRNFPTSPGALQTRALGGFGEVFVTRLDPSGAALRFSTYLGGRDYDFPGAVAVAGSDTVVVGWTKSTAFPTTAGALSRTYKNKGDGFVTRLNAGGTGLVYSTYLNSSGWDELNGVHVDGSGHVTIGGTVWITPTGGSDLPTTAGAYDRTFNGGQADAFIARLHSSGSRLLYASFLGGNANDFGRALALSASGEAVLGGKTLSTDFPTSSRAYDRTANGSDDAFVARLSNDGATLVGSTFLGSREKDTTMAVAVTRSDAVIAVGVGKTGFPTTTDAIQRSYGGGTGDGFLVALDAKLESLAFATFLGGSGYDGIYGVAVDAAGHATVAGETFSSGFPTTPGSVDPTYNGAGDAFVARIELSAPRTFTTTVTSLNPSTGIAVTADKKDANGRDQGTTPFTFTYGASTVATLTAPASSAAGPFKHWRLDGVAQASGQRTLSFTQSADRAARAEYWIHTHGTFAGYGKGCPGTGARIPTHSGVGHPDIGQRTGWAVANARPSAPGVLMVGLLRQSFDLGPIGLPGCTLLVLPVSEVPVFTSATGSGTLNVTLPQQPSFIGRHLVSQVAILDPGTATPVKVVTSGGVDMTIGGNR